MPGKCCFNETWLEVDDWKLWLRPGKDKYNASCLKCHKEFYLGHSGKGAVKTHIKGKRHQEITSAQKQCDIQLYVACNSKSSDNPETISSSSSNPSFPSGSSQQCTASQENTEIQHSASPLHRFILRDETSKAEIIWALNKVMTHNSARGEASSSKLFPLMFPDSMIAKEFKMQKDKVSYVITYGLGPYFQKSLIDEIKPCKYIAISFDESLNKVAQKAQMDFVVRFWKNDQVETRYLTSTFLESATAENLRTAFVDTIKQMELKLENIIQISLDGPNVNIKFLRDIKEFIQLENNEETQILDTGTCSLHIVQGAYKTAHNKVGFEIHDFLRTIYYLFNDFPSRRAEYTALSGSCKFPLKFCSIRWVENARVLDRAIQILPALKLYANTKKPPASNNFKKMKSALEDKLLLAKLQFLASVARQMEDFLTTFQANRPMVPFMYSEVFTLMKDIGKRFIKDDVMADNNSPNALLKLDVNITDVTKPVVEVDIGFGAKKACGNGTKDADIIRFRRDCKKFLCVLFDKLKEKSPLRYKIVKGASCISPAVMKNERLRVSRCNVLLQELVEKNLLTSAVADRAKRDFLKLCDMSSVQEKLTKFDWKEERLDTFLMNLVKEADLNNHELMNFFQIILILFHGNAEVERGFSVNKQCLVENLLEESLIAQRSVYNAVATLGGIENVNICKSMLLSVRSASSRRIEALKDKKAHVEKKANVSKVLTNELKQLEQLKRKIQEEKEEEVAELNSQIKKLKSQL